MGRVIPRDLKEAKVWEVLTPKKDSLIVYNYGLNFTHLSRNASVMVKDTRIKMSLFVAGLDRLSSNHGLAIILIRDMDISRFVIYVYFVEE